MASVGAALVGARGVGRGVPGGDGGRVFCPPDQFSLTCYVDDNSCWLVSRLPLYFYTMTSHRDIYIYKC
jgi:hypothetical protein